MRAIALLSLFFLAACSGPTEPGQRWPVDFRLVDVVSYTGNERVYFNPPTVTAEGGEGAVTIQGDFLLPCSNFPAVATAVRDGAQLRLNVDYDSYDLCDDSFAKFLYEAILPELEPGSYQLQVRQRVVHGRGGRTEFRVVLERTVEVR